jgi:aminomethyltransferase
METAAYLKKTSLHDLHVESGARMVPFAGYSMPLHYAPGVLREHLQVRESAGLFDVSHMGQVRVSGGGAAAALESVMPVDIEGLADGSQRYAVFTNDEGGIVDDLMVARYGHAFVLVVNAACRDADVAWLQSRIRARCHIEVLQDRDLLAIQGPSAASVLARVTPGIERLRFMSTARVSMVGADCLVSRSGYTGEDGYEISVPASHTEALGRTLAAEPEVELIGLGARDSLRLEAGLCLYGHDIDASTSPVEAGLSWALSRTRRLGGARAGGYPGADVIQQQLTDGVRRKRVGIASQERTPVRQGTELVDEQGVVVGRVTSGGFGPTANRPVAMGYVDAALAANGSTLYATIRGRRVEAQTAKLPFVPHRYYRG